MSPKNWNAKLLTPSDKFEQGKRKLYESCRVSALSGVGAKVCLP